MIHDKADEVIEELFQSLISRYQIGLESSMRGTDLIFDCDHLLHYKCHKINFKRGVSYIDSPDWTKSKKTTIKPITKKNVFSTLHSHLKSKGNKKRPRKNNKS